MHTITKTIRNSTLALCLSAAGWASAQVNQSLDLSGSVTARGPIREGAPGMRVEIGLGPALDSARLLLAHPSDPSLNWQLDNYTAGSPSSILRLFTPRGFALGVAAENAAFGNSWPDKGSRVAVPGQMSVGSDYLGFAAPAGGLIVAGSVGIGTPSPVAALDVVGSVHGTGVGLANVQGWWLGWNRSGGWGEVNFINHRGLGPGGFTFEQTADGVNLTRLATIDGNGNLGLGTATPQARLDVNGATRTKTLELNGGADIAELFSAAEELAPGTVVVADADHEGQVQVATTPYAEAVIGIVSGAGGIQPAQLLHQEGTLADGTIPVSTGGRVWCRCDASHGAIEPGTLLTSSATAGHAMRVTDKSRAQGAIVGKALTRLAVGRGLVLVWVTHQ